MPAMPSRQIDTPRRHSGAAQRNTKIQHLVVYLTCILCVPYPPDFPRFPLIYGKDC